MNDRTNHHQIVCSMCGAPQGRAHAPTCPALPVFGDVGVGDLIVVNVRAVVRIDDIGPSDKADGMRHFQGTAVSVSRRYVGDNGVLVPVTFAEKGV